MQWVNLHLHYLCPLFPFGSCRACWEGKPLCGQSAAIQCVFFFHALLLSSFLNQRPEPGRALLLQEFIYALLSHSPSLPLCLFLCALHFQRITMALRRGRIFAVRRTDTSCRMTWKRAQSGKRVSLRGPGWGTVRGCRTPTMAILREGHVSSFEWTG